MLRYTSYDIVFQEIPGEITLAINISNCPNHCEGCHSPHLQEDTGEILTESTLSLLLENYGNAITCICFMGGDNSPEEVLNLAQFIRRGAIHRAQYTHPAPPIKTAWYSGSSQLYKNAQHGFDYIKLGEYIEELGGLDSPKTNQRLYKIINGKMVDMTNHFIKEKFSKYMKRINYLNATDIKKN